MSNFQGKSVRDHRNEIVKFSSYMFYHAILPAESESDLRAKLLKYDQELLF